MLKCVTVSSPTPSFASGVFVMGVTTISVFTVTLDGTEVGGVPPDLSFFADSVFDIVEKMKYEKKMNGAKNVWSKLCWFSDTTLSVTYVQATDGFAD